MKHNDITNTKHKLSDANYENIFNVYSDENGYYYYNLLRTVNFPEELENNTYAIYETQFNDTWLSLAWKFYSNVKLWWIICAVNNIYNPFVKLQPGTKIKILNTDIVKRALYYIKQS